MDNTQADLITNRLDEISKILAGAELNIHDEVANYLGKFFNEAFVAAKDAEECPPMIKMILERILSQESQMDSSTPSSTDPKPEA